MCKQETDNQHAYSACGTCQVMRPYIVLAATTFYRPCGLVVNCAVVMVATACDVECSILAHALFILYNE